jgi:short-subunit dehydrogenase
MTTKELTGTAALVTGASIGIGAATAPQLTALIVEADITDRTEA